MSRFNASTVQKTVTVNHEGGKAYTMAPDLDLYATTVTTLLTDKYYEKTDERIERIKDLVKKNDPMFVAQMAVYARETMNLRSVPILLSCLLSEKHSGDSLVSRCLNRVIKRADELTETLACYQMLYGTGKNSKKLNNLSKQVQKGLALGFNRFDEYQFAKYNRKLKDVTLRDTLFLAHPVPKDSGQQLIFDKIVKDELKTPDTWETKISAVGQQKFENEEEKVEAKKDEWERLVMEGKLGYMALLRNLRNLLEAGISKEAMAKVCERLADKNEVLRSKQFPFRFLAAYHELKGMVSPYAAAIIDSLEEAIKHSAATVPGFDANTTLFISNDVSGSMSGSISVHSKISTREVGLVLGLILRERCKAVTMSVFSDDLQLVNVPKGNILTNCDHLGTGAGGGTNGFLIPQGLLKLNQEFDKVIVFTDCELWDNTTQFYSGQQNSFADHWHMYKNKFPNSKLYMFDLAGYGTTPISMVEKDVYQLAGWNEKVFGILDSLDKGSDAVAEIRKIEV